MRRGNGLISLEDLANYRSIWREPIHGAYRGYEIWGMPPPSSGGVLIVEMLNMRYRKVARPVELHKRFEQRAP